MLRSVNSEGQWWGEARGLGSCHGGHRGAWVAAGWASQGKEAGCGPGGAQSRRRLTGCCLWQSGDGGPESRSAEGLLPLLVQCQQFRQRGGGD